MDILENKIYDLIERQQIMIEILFSYVPEKEKLAAMSDMAERIRNEVINVSMEDQNVKHQ